MITRRSFLKQTALITASSAFPAIWVPRNKTHVGVALVGLGYYSTDLLAPALQLTKYASLKGIVTGSPWKIPLWQEKYGIPDQNVYNYETMHRIADNDEIDVVYIVLPTGMHSEYAVIAANTGKHVWCEKPMARTEAECSAIIKACQRNKVKLSIGYRMQHEPNTREIMSYAISQPFGNIESLSAKAGYYDSRTDHWKQKKEMGGGAMYDMGVYPLNAVRYATGEEPIAVFDCAHTTNRPDVYHEVDETTDFKLEFPGGVIATGRTSLGEGMNSLEVNCRKGWYRLAPFQSYSGIQGQTSSGKLFTDQVANQQANQMDNDARAILDNSDVLVPGEEGMRDIRIVEAIYRSAAEGGARISL